MTTFADHRIELPAHATGNVRTTCPECSHARKKSKDRCLAVNADKGVWVCHHCGWKGRLDTRSPEQRQRATSRQATQSQVNHALIVLEIAKSDRANGVEHNATDVESIRGAIKTINKVTPRERRLSTTKPQRDNSHATDCALREGGNHIEHDDSVSICDGCGHYFKIRYPTQWLCAICEPPEAA